MLRPTCRCDGLPPMNDSGPELVHSGKVRDLYEVDDRHLVMVASDRISAYDVVFGQEIPDKGRILTAMTVFWDELLSGIAPTHLVSSDIDRFPPGARREQWRGRALLVRRARMLPIECIVRGYLTGSAWAEYSSSGTVHGTPLPEGLVESERFPRPVFTPSTKAEEGHDVNIGFDEAVELVGPDLAEEARRISLAAYETAARHAAGRGVIIADTKFELGVVDGRLVLADELLTPDSSRFWPVEGWARGTTPPSLDKQPLRDEVSRSGWDRSPPAPALSPATVEATRERYVTAYERITGRPFSDWPGEEKEQA